MTYDTLIKILGTSGRKLSEKCRKEHSSTFLQEGRLKKSKRRIILGKLAEERSRGWESGGEDRQRGKVGWGSTYAQGERREGGGEKSPVSYAGF